MLIVGVLLVNGATDAPNAIATSIVARALSPKAAVWMAAGCNLLGVLAAVWLNATVAETVSALADFGEDPRKASIGLCAALAAIVLWAIGAWCFGIPTSESHALIAALSGAAIAVGGHTDALNASAWGKVLFGLPFSLLVGALGGWVAVWLVKSGFHTKDRRKTAQAMRRLQRLGSAAMAFAHGAQDGQKWIAVFWLALTLTNGFATHAQTIPLWAAVGTAVLMALGTAIGGKRIIRTVGTKMGASAPHESFSADVAAAGVLLGAAAFGMPVSTTHVKTAAMLGTAMGGRVRAVNWSVAAEMLWAWVLTFPGCGALGFLAARLFFRLF